MRVARAEQSVVVAAVKRCRRSERGTRRTHNGATEQTQLDMAAIGVAGFTLTLSVAPPTNFDLLVQNSTAGSGAVEGSVGAVPEPATLGLLAIGVSAIFMRRRRSR